MRLRFLVVKNKLPSCEEVNDLWKETGWIKVKCIKFLKNQTQPVLQYNHPESDIWINVPLFVEERQENEYPNKATF